MSTITINGSGISSALMDLLTSNDSIVPGSAPGYELCKTLYESHVLGGKAVEKPVRLAMSKPRRVVIPDAPDAVVEAFTREWARLGADLHIRNTAYLSRIYGISSIIYGAPGEPTDQPIDPWKLAAIPDLYFNSLDPLNIAGSAVTNQNPNAPDFQKPMEYITAAGQRYHPSRSCTVMCGPPIYISYTASAFGFTGRSVFQRALFPMKTFVQSMITDDLVTRKAGVLISKQKGPGSIINNMMQKAAGVKRSLLKEAGTGNVLTIDVEESIEALNMQNTDTAMTVARDNCIANIAAASDVPAILLKDEAFANGFGEGSEDSKAVVQYIDSVRDDLRPLYEFFDRIVQYRAWNEDFFNAISAAHPDLYAGRSYKDVFYEWQSAFVATWPSLMEEPESERVKVAETKLRGVTEILRTILPIADPANKAALVAWAQDNLNQMNEMFEVEMSLDFEELAAYEPPTPSAEPTPGAGT
jgi:hypothetical protein